MELDRFPTFELTDRIYRQLVVIDGHMSKLSAEKGKHIRVILRKTSNIRSINSSLAIEGNEMPLSKTIDMIDGKTVQGPFDEIVETRIDFFKRQEEVQKLYPKYKEMKFKTI